MLISLARIAELAIAIALGLLLHDALQRFVHS